jgi:galactonate dehydratase
VAGLGHQLGDRAHVPDDNTGRDLLDYLIDPEPLVLGEGALAVPAGPGLGIEVDEARVREAARGGHRWRNPVWRHDDGTLAEW